MPSHGGRGSVPVSTPLLPPMRVMAKRALFSVLILTLLVPLVALGFAQSGLLTPLMEQRAITALRNAVPPHLTVNTGSASVMVDFPASLAVQFDDVVILQINTGDRVASISQLALTLRTGPLLRGTPEIESVRVQGALITLPAPIIAPPRLTIDTLDTPTETLFNAADAMMDMVRVRAPGLEVSLRDIAIILPKYDDALESSIKLVQVRALFDEGVVISGNVESTLLPHDSVVAVSARGTVSGSGHLSDLFIESPALPVPARNFLFAFSNVKEDRSPSAPRRPVDARVSLLLERSADQIISKTVTIEPEAVAFKLADEDEVPADFKLVLNHRTGDKALSVMPSRVQIGRTGFILNGGVRDAPDMEGAYEIELLANNGILDPIDTPVAAMAFGSSVSLIFHPESGVMDVPTWRLETTGGTFDATGQFDFGAPTPYAVMRITSPRMTMDALKQSWPAPIARGARRWVLQNMAGGVARNILFDVAEPLRRRIEGSVTRLTGDTIVKLDVEGVRFDIAGDIPPVRDAVGTLSVEDRVATITLQSGTVFMDGGTTADAANGVLTIQPRDLEGRIKAHVNVDVSGDATSVGQLIGYKPIAAQRFYPFKPSDLSGSVSARVSMDFLLNDIRADGGPDWAVSMDVTNAALASPVEGRTLRNVNGIININRQRVDLDVSAILDGLPADIEMLIPFAGSSLAPKRTIVMKLGDKERNALAPGLDVILAGTTPLTIERAEGNANRIEMNLVDTRLSLPWVGWSKGKGVAGKAGFDLLQNGSTTQLQNFQLDGQGFSARGAVRVTKAGLSALDFTNVKLNRYDDFNISIQREGKRYLIDVTGQSIDARSLIRTIRSAMRRSGSGSDQTQATITARLDRVLGFSDEVMRNVRAEILIGRGGVESASIQASTDSGLPVSINLRGVGAKRIIAVESLDAGDLLRFVDLYGQIRGGILDVNLNGDTGGRTIGAMKITDFRVFNEPRLASLVNTQSSNAGSLRDAVNTDIDTGEVRFNLAYADIVFGDKSLDLQRGVLRGPLVGLTMQGRAYDANNLMRITGTFLPAYGLNTLFADIPIVGILLGNGRDRGLIGVTFLLTGKADKPDVTVNPLSVIAPGIFRSIFEFR